MAAAVRPSSYRRTEVETCVLRRRQSLSWDLCGRTCSLEALERDVTKAELIKIAESVPEECA